MKSKQVQQSDWLSIYLFYEGDLNTLLINVINPLLKELYKKRLIKKHFFIRYWKNGQHIRLRMMPCETITKNNLFELFLQKLSEIVEKIQFDEENLKIELSDYIQELIRYGGENAISKAEENFELSSDISMEILCKYKKTWDYSSAISTALQMHLLFTRAMNIDNKQVMSFLEYIMMYNLNMALKYKIEFGNEEEVRMMFSLFEKSYQLQKETINRICEFIWTTNNWSSDDWKSVWYRKNFFNINEISELEKAGMLQKPKWRKDFTSLEIPREKTICWSIFDSFFHMTNNRLGIYPRDEPFIYYLLLKGMETVFQKESTKQ